ncbi:hypothetical protein RFI_07031 [Reticulomyxa filosa]|uniref:Uncharacterized protein n=1 Tax=Reticulomyxa filosa TaxID=46433 RepID=X6NW26_RETFI|nr:hypothetical protein RFI_07031 [Reticulomyxa filosa]|eukprot:ETO30088.1 hypothetical protein RFI_07031 [Reticulomyxa filosa]
MYVGTKSHKNVKAAQPKPPTEVKEEVVKVENSAPCVRTGDDYYNKYLLVQVPEQQGPGHNNRKTENQKNNPNAAAFRQRFIFQDQVTSRVTAPDKVNDNNKSNTNDNAAPIENQTTSLNVPSDTDKEREEKKEESHKNLKRTLSQMRDDSSSNTVVNLIDDNDDPVSSSNKEQSDVNDAPSDAPEPNSANTPEKEDLFKYLALWTGIYD